VTTETKKGKKGKEPYDQLSERVCETTGCETRIKARLVRIKPTARLCYRCWKNNRSRGRRGR
jgi:hypothetical protein